MRTVLLLVTALACLCAGGLRAAEADVSVEIDVAADIGPATFRASGFLHALSADQPPQELLEPLKPRIFRLNPANVGLGAADGVYERATAMGARIHVGLASAQGCSGRYPCPGDDGDWTKWEKTVDYLLANARERGYDRLDWDVWNEPNLKDYWVRENEQFREMWMRTARKIRAWDPEATIVGPSICGFRTEWLQSFLLWAKSENVLPDVICWHEFDDPAAIPAHAAHLRGFLRDNGIDISRFSLNEIIGARYVTQPGPTLWYLWAVEAADIESAAHACWSDEPREFNGCMPGLLDGLLTVVDRRPRSTWWVYKRYADVTGRLLRVTPTPDATAIAGWDAPETQVHAVFGRKSEHKGDLHARLTNLDRATGLVANGVVRVVVERIPDSGWNALAAPVLVSDTIERVESNALAVTIRDLGPTDAAFVRLSRP